MDLIGCNSYFSREIDSPCVEFGAYSGKLTAIFNPPSTDAKVVFMTRKLSMMLIREQNPISSKQKRSGLSGEQIVGQRQPYPTSRARLLQVLKFVVRPELLRTVPYILYIDIVPLFTPIVLCLRASRMAQKDG